MENKEIIKMVNDIQDNIVMRLYMEANEHELLKNEVSADHADLNRYLNPLLEDLFNNLSDFLQSIGETDIMYINLKTGYYEGIVKEENLYDKSTGNCRCPITRDPNKGGSWEIELKDEDTGETYWC